MKKYYVKLTVFVFFIVAVLCLCISSVYSKTGLEWGVDGDYYYKEGNYEKAIECYKEALKEYPDSANLYYNTGNCYLKLKKYDKAIEYYEICLDKNPSHELAPGKIAEAKKLKEATSTPAPTLTPTFAPQPTPVSTLSIINLQNGDQVSFPLEIKGYTKPFAIVEIKHECKSVLSGGLIAVEGPAETSRISADENGYFSVNYYSGQGSGTQHKITVTVTETSGNKFADTVINVVEK